VVHELNELILPQDINQGQKILLRLRPAHAPDTMYDEDQVIGTMLHEVSSTNSVRHHTTYAELTPHSS
jgi:hypothetical protein